MAGDELSGTSAGVGYGNKATEADTDLTNDHNKTRYGIGHSKAYSGGSETYASGSVGGTGAGNKVNAAGQGTDLTEEHSNTRYDMANHAAPYKDGHDQYKSGTVGGPGWGNKTAGTKTDSTSGKLMEKLGDMTNNEELAERGKAKRDAYSAGE